ncbi:MAG: sialidase family protein [Candidatus Binatia bacterium]
MKRLVFSAFVLALWSGSAFGQEVILSQVSKHQEMGEGKQAGEAWVVADPRDPQKLVVIWLATRGGLAGTVMSPDVGYCGIGRTTDGGRTWSHERAPYRGYDNDVVSSQLPICGDPAGGILSDGSIVFTAILLGHRDWVQSITSTDNGATWSTPTAPFSLDQWVLAIGESGRPQDMGPGRQWLAVDPVLNHVYVQSQVDAATFGRTMTVSTDAGATWSVPRNVGSTSLGPIGAAHGKVAGVFSQGAERIFQTSTDKGETWERNPMPVGEGAGRGFVAADRTTPDRFAVLLTRGSDTLEVWVTTDAGVTVENWTHRRTFTVAELGEGANFSRPWIAYGPHGELGVVWRYHYADGSYDVDGVVSLDGGTTWKAPVRLTAPRGPAPSGNLGSDDCACNLHLSGSTLSTTWGDWTTGHRELWFGSFEYGTE